MTRSKFYEEVEDMLKNPINPGDKISALGFTAEIKEVLYAYIDTETKWGMKPFADVEFIDTNGKYRHYKSSYDGGKILFQDDRVAEFKAEY